MMGLGKGDSFKKIAIFGIYVKNFSGVYICNWGL